MNKTYFKFAVLFLLVAAMFVGCLKDSDIVEDAVGSVDQQNLVAPINDNEVVGSTSEVISGQYIVVYKEGAISGRSSAMTYAATQEAMKEEVMTTLQRNNISPEKMTFVYGSSIIGFALKDVTEQEIEKLRRDEQVDYIEQDQTASISMGGPPGGGGGGGQQTPWGITRVNGGTSGAGSGSAYIVDTGIDMDHPDLNVDQSNWFSAWSSGGNAGPEDKHGHGSHVSGTVAAIDNSEGVIGVAPGANVIAVKVLDRRGSGSNSGVIAGVDYVGGNAGNGDVANMSLGGGISTALDNAVIAASSACPFALAAGNESQHANNSSPARANGSNIYTIASMTSSDGWSSFSNYGQPPVDWIAPGSSVYSTYKGGGYATLSGTSMAAPHVCGLLLLGSISDGGDVTRVSGDVYDVASH